MEEHKPDKAIGNIVYHRQQSHRIAALADGIFAIIMTLLVLDIRVPVTATWHSDYGALLALKEVLPKILAYFLSFTVAGLFWSVYVNQYNYIKAPDRNLNMISLFFFMFCALMPFTTSFLAEDIHSHVACALYALNIFIFSTFLRLHWLYASKNGLTYSDDVPIETINKLFRRRAIFSEVCYAASVGLSFLSSDVT